MGDNHSVETITVAIQSPGDMGHGVGRDLIERGFRVLTCLTGRSTRSITLTKAGGLEVVPDLNTLVSQANLVLSIVPPCAAEELAAQILQAMHHTQYYPVYAECNAIAPRTVQAIAKTFTDSASPFIDAGIIGLAPREGRAPTRFYCSGADTTILEMLNGGGMRVHRLGPKIGQASAMKMIYAAVTKGTMTLHAVALIAAQLQGLFPDYANEMEKSQPQVWAAMKHMVPRLPVDAGRWVGEMREISQFFIDTDLPGDFHIGAAEIFELLNKTPVAAETRETIDENRTLEEAVTMYSAQVRTNQGN